MKAAMDAVRSKKLELALVIGAVLVVVNQFYPILDEASISEVVKLFLLYIGGQSGIEIARRF